MKFLMLILLLLIVATSVRFGAGFLSARVENPGLVSGVLPDCPDKPNCVASFATREAQKIAPLNNASDPQQTLEMLVHIIESMAGATIVQREKNFIHATFTSRLFGFIDDVYFLYQADQSIIDVKSQSRLGYSDLGANRKRIEEIRLRFGQAG